MPGETFRVNLTNPLPLTLANHTLAASDYLLTIKSINGEVVKAQKGTGKKRFIIFVPTP